MITFGSLFTGVGGFDLGFERAGMTCLWQCEIDKHATAVLDKHWPNTTRYTDVREIGKHNLAAVDVICGGFPCQDVPLAGLRKGLEGKRSTLWTEFLRIVCEIRPGWVVIENVRGLLTSDGGEFFRGILFGLSTNGYDAEWKIIRASDFGFRHRRERVYIIAYPKRNGDSEFLGEFRIFSKWEEEQNKRRTNWIELVMEPGEVAPSKWQQAGQLSDAEPTLIRVHDGISKRSYENRLKQMGNAIVVDIAEWIGRRIVDAASN